MFRNFLKSKYLTETTEEERSSLLIKAGSLSEQRGNFENAIRYYLEAKAYLPAISLIERIGMDLLRTGRKGDLASWIYALPDDLLQKNPWLLFYLTMTKHLMVGKENVITLQKAYQLFKERGEVKGEMICLGRWISTIVHAGIHHFPILPLMKEAEVLLESTRGEAYKYERATLWYCMSQAYFLVEGDIRKGIRACENAYLISKQIHDIPLQVYALSSSAVGFIFVGEFSRAEEACQKIDALTEKVEHPKELKTIKLMVNCILANFQGDFEKAHPLIKTVQMEIEKYGFITIAPWVYEITGYLKLMRGDFTDAVEIGNRYVSAARSLGNAFLKGLALRLSGLIYLYQKDFGKAKEAIDQSIEALSKEAPSRYHLNRAKIILGLIYHETKEVERGEKELHEALQYFSSISSYNSLIESHWCLAFLKWDQKKREEATLHLRTGFKIAAEKKYRYFYLLGKNYLGKACLLALELKIEEAIDYITQLLILHLSPATEEELNKLSNHSDPAIQNMVWEVRRKILRSRVPRLQIETLGGFRVFRGDSLIEEKDWDRQQPKQLLKAIVSRGTTSIPKEILIEDLWPEEKPKRAENNFKTTLQRLRISLEPTHPQDFGSSYIHLHDSQILLDQELCQVDINQFLSLIKQGEEMEKRGEEKKALSFFTEALEMYKGDFLKDDLYSPWAENKREELRNKYIELLHQTAHLHDRQGSFKKAIDCFKKVIQADPLLEESYQKLMTLYSEKGFTNEALKTYEACKKVLKKELNSTPDATTDAIYNKILEKIESSQRAKPKDLNEKTKPRG
jgi:two-component SAPR family response regulator